MTTDFRDTERHEKNMKNMTLTNIATACGGTYYGTEADKDREIAELKAMIAELKSK